MAGAWRGAVGCEVGDGTACPLQRGFSAPNKEKNEVQRYVILTQK